MEEYSPALKDMLAKLQPGEQPGDNLSIPDPKPPKRVVVIESIPEEMHFLLYKESLKVQLAPPTRFEGLMHDRYLMDKQFTMDELHEGALKFDRRMSERQKEQAIRNRIDRERRKASRRKSAGRKAQQKKSRQANRG